MTKRNKKEPVQPDFLPMNQKDLQRLGWNGIDVLIVTGDAYVDHPAFGPALLGRWLTAHGYKTGITAQPDWRDPSALQALGRPRLFAGITAGALDSMLAHYTAFRKKRSDDAYTPGGRAGARPNRAAIVYANLARQAFPGLPIILGGIEASLRRAVHYDFWSDRLRRPIILDAKADLLVYGMAERALLEAARRLDRNPGDLPADIPGTAFASGPGKPPEGAEVVRWPSLEEIEAEPFQLVQTALAMERHVHLGDHWAVQNAGGRDIWFAPPARPLTPDELDRLYDLPFARRAHPSYKKPIPAATMLAASINTHRGCGGGCSFCSLALHQGRRVSSRSSRSILAEAGRLARDPEVKGSISDLGGPSAGMWEATCAKVGPCRRPSCLHPRICRHFIVDQSANVELLQQVRDLPGIRHARVASGLRYDLALADPQALERLVSDFVGGQLKVAPEHIAPNVLDLMRKPGREVFERFMAFFKNASKKAGLEQYLVPYLMSAFPGTTDADMRALADWLKSQGWKPQQVQCFIPTPGTLATAMYYAGRDDQGRPIPVARTDAERLRQHGRIAPRPQKKRRGR